MNVNDFDFYLPEELIAQNPLPERTASRLLVLNKQTGAVEHRQFTDLKGYLKAGDTLVLNDTRVIPARLFGVKEGTGAHIEVLLLKPLGDDCWETLVKPGKRVKPGTRILFGDGLLTAECLDSTEVGGRMIRFEYKGIFNELLDQLGEMPLPPYIKAQLNDSERYQTVYAKHRGSAAAPTAGLHFTKEYLAELKAMGINLAFLTLHVGLGTFRPVMAETVEEHEMHSEYYMLNEENARIINETKARGGRIVAVGTTSCRTLETIGKKHGGKLVAEEGWTNIFIYPGYTFSVIDGLVTNFHLPKSTLVMLVSALAGRENILRAYEEAIRLKYRFFSFGDAMLIL
ncbi:MULTISPECIES: tRNA preQ1(34) S-adenosylmethionine ribosyltransferase-isomerase QueA [Aneurinibacillus]|uniref:S-adenosylmethionine:tRNA ribosyltransferase-isomerase n=1 Tax=Aneurinibacillus thermoaerophilus TaxID=143495 RepID=A0A1G7YA34_ANETH|nr:MULTISPECIES: tRNA preQ1(34) S-adenosylmethionine ribosyltransferase-isomerase QueA [Aneurinibacillus]AMA72154.1 S-adenosylmethionine:tRNA ribosyltransferase-isomerase [Aneurinibacillus sp. XH2]MED0676439.1 tRNA preQ1(34) S-adenosylmethionine ribosyltransferase-isomerase QueA [Aneurinibacillus thermoaerophilus]MED0678951.1 tRNA preQ1(34) S-adenosylmethionine ribosyltransferase-isomerase QueA [Aneurinibacillus thermoaerophilus]MED0736488.1 tRNA preQ1(34) S-adenosylmethionine ribosyltransferas